MGGVDGGEQGGASQSQAAASRAHRLGVYSALMDEVSLRMGLSFLGPRSSLWRPVDVTQRSFLVPAALPGPCSKPPRVAGPATALESSPLAAWKVGGTDSVPGPIQFKSTSQECPDHGKASGGPRDPCFTSAQSGLDCLNFLCLSFLLCKMG